MSKELCDCGKVAVWCYMPGYSGGGNSHSCDDCVPRGCECNHNYVKKDAYLPEMKQDYLPKEEDLPVKWIEEGKVWCRVDDQGREWPCCEYWHDEEGWDIEEEYIVETFEK